MEKALLDQWMKEYQEFVARNPERKERFETRSGIPLKPLYTSADQGDLSEEGELGFPGQYPFTRGVYPTMYRGRLWTKRIPAGHHTAEEYNRRQRELFEQGSMGTVFDPCGTTLRGLDTDLAPRELVGQCGTPIDSLQDFEIAFADIPLDRLTNSLTDPSPFTLVAMHFASAEKQGIPLYKLMGTSNQSDFIDHYIACHMYLRFGLEGHLRILLDHVRFCIQQVPKWHPLSIVGQHMAEGGATPVQELAFALSTGIFYVGEIVKQGLEVDTFAPRLSFLFGVGAEFFEDIAKLRAGRRMWARIMKERFGAKDPRSQLFKFHVHHQGIMYTQKQPLNNIVRSCLNTLAAVLGGAQSMATTPYDEALWIPTERAHRVALMTQNIIAEESGIADVIDPLGGSYLVESLTREIEERAWEYIERIDSLGGMFEATRRGYPQRETAASAIKFQRELDAGERVLVGVNKYVVPEEVPSREQEKVNPELIERQIERTRRLKRERDQRQAAEALRELGRAARGQGNVFQAVVGAVKANVTSGEIIQELREVCGVGMPLNIMAVIP